MVFTSTAGHPDSVVLRSFYDRLVRQASGDEKPDRAFYGAWWQSSDPDAGLDWGQIKQANPALSGKRLTRPAIVTEHSILPPDSWRRERLNHFVDTVANGAFNPGVWAACRTRGPLEDAAGPFALAVDIQPGWERATISVAALRPDGRIGVEVHADLRATADQPITAARLVAEIRAFAADYPVALVAYDSISAAAAELERAGLEHGLPMKVYKTGEMSRAAMDVTEMVLAGRLAHDDRLLDAQIPLVARRPLGVDGAFLFGRLASRGPIDAVISATLAAHAIAKPPQYPRLS
jgi:hypothetical protein